MFVPLVVSTLANRMANDPGKVLAEHPDQRSRLVDDPSLLSGAVEEVLRWVTPIAAMSRTATADAVIGD